MRKKVTACKQGTKTHTHMYVPIRSSLAQYPRTRGGVGGRREGVGGRRGGRRSRYNARARLRHRRLLLLLLLQLPPAPDTCSRSQSVDMSIRRDPTSLRRLVRLHRPSSSSPSPCSMGVFIAASSHCPRHFRYAFPSQSWYSDDHILCHFSGGQSILRRAWNTIRNNVNIRELGLG